MTSTPSTGTVTRQPTIPSTQVASATPTPRPTLLPTRTRMPASPTPVPSATVAVVAPENAGTPTTYSYEIVHIYPHDSNAFTQGLVYEDGNFYEGTGWWGKSNLRQVDIETGEVLQQVDLPESYFGEGITTWQDRIIQITWRSNVAFVYDKESFEQIGQFNYETEGWGITHDGSKLIMSDGTNILTFRDPDSFEPIGQVAVMDGNTPITQLNELEYVNGEVWANVWQTDRIVRIAPDSGEVVGWIELAGIYPNDDPNNPDDVLNGIAYDSVHDRLFVTGKLWGQLFEIRLLPAE